MDKHYITANDLLDDSFRLADQILQSGFRPDYIVGVWRGGTPIGIAVQEYLQLRGIETDHISIRTSSYSSITVRSSLVRVHGLDYIIDNINAHNKLLIVDDVFDTGLSIDAIIRELREKCRLNMPGEVRIATVYFKPKKNRTKRKPDYCIHETEEWLIFPHEIIGLSPAEIAENKSAVLNELLKEK